MSKHQRRAPRLRPDHNKTLEIFEVEGAKRRGGVWMIRQIGVEETSNESYLDGGV